MYIIQICLCTNNHCRVTFKGVLQKYKLKKKQNTKLLIYPDQWHHIKNKKCLIALSKYPNCDANTETVISK